MKPKHRRLVTVLAALSLMGLGAAGILSSFRDQLIFFYTPTDLLVAQSKPGFDAAREIRIGGLVKVGSIRTEGDATHFVITDLTDDVPANYHGLLPALFREGQGVVAQGTLDADGTLVARTILAKHDENYMPKEVADALKRSGRWQEGQP